MTDDASADPFHDELAHVVLQAYAAGSDVEGIFSLDSVPDEIPDWKVRIERVSHVDEPDDTADADPAVDDDDDDGGTIPPGRSDPDLGDSSDPP